MSSPLGLGLADRLGAGVALVLQGLGLHLDVLPLRLQLAKHHGIDLQAAPQHERFDLLQAGTK